MSGTPLERDLEDLATLLSLIEPTRFAPSEAGLHPASLRAQARPYLMRRRKEDVLDSLPPVRETTDWLALCAPQERSYRAAITEYRETSGPVNELALLTRLRAICTQRGDRLAELAGDGKRPRSPRTSCRVAVVVPAGGPVRATAGTGAAVARRRSTRRTS